MGVFLLIISEQGLYFCLPHARGGVSKSCSWRPTTCPSSPRSWGCFITPHLVARYRAVFPTLVGVFLCWRRSLHRATGLPHARGGVSPVPVLSRRAGGSSPRSWGCFLGPASAGVGGAVFPTLVGVFHFLGIPQAQILCLPHARGGVSGRRYNGSDFLGSSPRSWGCFQRSVSMGRDVAVFPTLVGVFPSRRKWIWRRRCLPHARGGVSVCHP